MYMDSNKEVQASWQLYTQFVKGESHACFNNELKCKNEGRCEIKHGVPHCICPEEYEGLICQFFVGNRPNYTSNKNGIQLIVSP